MRTILLCITITVLTTMPMFADEPGWTESKRRDMRDLVIDGIVLNVSKSHDINANKHMELWSAEIKVSKVTKGPKSFEDKTITVVYERGAVIKGTHARYKRCPRCPDLSVGLTGLFFLKKCTVSHIKALELPATMRGVFILEMASDFSKEIKQKAKE